MKPKLWLLTLISTFSLSNMVWAVAPYSPPCEGETRKLDEVRDKFEKCIENFTLTTDKERAEQIKEKCSSEFDNYLNAITEFKVCRDHTNTFHIKK